MVSYSLFLSLLTTAMGSCERLHVHDESLINTVGKFTCQPGKLYKSALPKGIGKSMCFSTHPYIYKH